MELKIPPVLVTAIFGVLIYLLATFLPFGYFDFFGRRELLFFLGALGILITGSSIFQLVKSKTTVDPGNPSKASRLVTSGMYKYSRNPMYLAMLLLLTVWVLHLGNAFNALFLAGFVKYMTKFQILPEEEALKKTFGKEYTKYCAAVRRWF